MPGSRSSRRRGPAHRTAARAQTCCLTPKTRVSRWTPQLVAYYQLDRAAVVWVAIGTADAAYLGTEERDKAGSGFVPTHRRYVAHAACRTRLVSVAPCQDRCMNKECSLQHSRSSHQLALGAEQINRLLLVADEANEQTARTINRRPRRRTRPAKSVWHPGIIPSYCG